MQRPMFLLFALCGLLWPSVAVFTYAQEEEEVSATAPDIRLRYGFNFDYPEPDTLFVDWSTVYVKSSAESAVAIGSPVARYGLQLRSRVKNPDGYGDNPIDATSLVLDIRLQPSDPAPQTYFYEGEYAQVRRDTFLVHVREPQPEREYIVLLDAYFSEGLEESVSWESPGLPNPIVPVPEGSFPDSFWEGVHLSASPTIVRKDAGATTIEIKAQLYEPAYPDIQVVPVLLREISAFGILGEVSEAFSLDVDPFVIKEGELSATGQATLTPFNAQFQNTLISNDIFITIGAHGRQGSRRAHIRLLDDDRPTTEIELTVSDLVVSTDGRATDVTVTGTLNGALLDEAVSFHLGVMPPTSAARDTDFGIRLARLTIPAGQATGTTTVRVTPRNQNGGQIWLGVAEHPTIGTGSNQRTIIVKEAAIELVRQPSRLIEAIRVLPQRLVREDAGQVNVDLKVSLKEASLVDETVRFEIVDFCDPDIVTGGIQCAPTEEESSPAAQRETDYFATLPPLTIPAGQTEGKAILSLEIVDNPDTEGNRTFYVVATLGNSRYREFVLISDDETETSFVDLSASPTEIDEDSGQTTITITGTLSGLALSETVTFVLSPNEIGRNSATRDADYTAVFEPLTIPAGQTEGTATLTITPTPNDGEEQDEVILLAPVEKVKITEDGEERELFVPWLRISLKDVADAPASATQTEEAPSSLAFDAPASTVLSGTVGEALSEVLPTATSDPEGALTYRVFNLPAALTFDATTRTITGTPTTAGETSIEYYALAEGVSPAVLTYTIDIQEKPKVIVELKGIAAAPLSMSEDADEAVDITLTVSLRKPASEAALVALAIVGPLEGKQAKRHEDFTATLPSTVTIPEGETKTTAVLTVLPKDNQIADGNRFFGVQATSPSGHQAQIDIQIIDNETASETASAGDDSATPDGGEDDGEDSEDSEVTEDSFAFAGTVADQAYTEGTEITALVLPEATGGEGAVSYRVFDLPAGLAFDAATRTIAGTPTAATDGAVEVIYLAQDSAEVGITLTFSVTVNPPLSFGDFSDLLGVGGG